MEMKKVACAVIFAAASVSAVLAEPAAVSPAAATTAAAGSAPAPGPSSAAAATMPVIGSIVGASLASVVAYFLQ